MKALCFLLAFFFVSLQNYAQLYIAKGGTVSFFSEAPLENIEAESKSVNAIINSENSEIAVIIPVSSFQFKKALMQEHFNEKYMESQKYREARFKGRILGDVDYKKEGVYSVTASGLLDLHGVEKNYIEKGTLTVKGGTLLLDCKFTINLRHHKIAVPSIVSQKIAEQVLITIHLTCIPYNK